MHKAAWFFILLFPLFLVSCSPQEAEYISNNQDKNPTIPPKSQDQVSLGDVKHKVNILSEKYRNPKWSTLRFKDWRGVGKIYMKFDKTENKTYAWAILNKLKATEINKNYSIWLINDEADNELDTGKIIFDEEGVGYWYYEFIGPGEHYNYLKANVLEEDNKILEANFSPKLY